MKKGRRNHGRHWSLRTGGTRESLRHSSAAIGTVYLLGEVVGALVFGKLSDKLGRRSLFMVTLGVFLIGSGLSAFTLGQGTGWLIYFYATRFLAGTGIGGEYAAINSAIDEMMPSRYRGASTSGSTARTGPDRSSARSRPSYYSTRCRRTPHGG